MATPVSRYNYSGDRGDNLLDASTLDGSIQVRGVDISGNAGNDTLIGGSGKDTLKGGDGNDTLFANLTDLQGVSAGSIVYDGGNGNDTLDLSQIDYDPGLGTYVKIGGTTGVGSIWTNVFNPDGTIFGFDTAEAKYVNNLKGIENVVMGGGDDWVDMMNGAGNNVLDGGAGNDVLNAGDGNDVVRGSDGNDMVNGGWGDDQLIGGQGSDMFLLLGRLAGQYTRDTIIDFDNDGTDGESDSLWFWQGYTIQWDPNSSVLHGYLFDGTTAFGEITLVGLDYSDAASVPIHYGLNTTTGGPLI